MAAAAPPADEHDFELLHLDPNDVFSCPICNELFSADAYPVDRRPMMACLNGHTLCAACFRQLSARAHAECPTCRRRMAAEGTVNRSLIDAMQMHRLNNDASVSVEHPRVVAEHFHQPPAYNPAFTAAAFAPGFSVDADSEFIPPTAIHLTEKQVKEALFREASAHTMWRTAAVDDFLITNVKSSWAFLYLLDSFKETRSIETVTKAYKLGTAIDGRQNGVPPGIHEITMTPSAHFVDATEYYKIPHTEYVKNCYECDRSGKVSCKRCSGRGIDHCKVCEGKGLEPDSTATPPKWCASCDGKRTIKCNECRGCGSTTCTDCDGSGKVKCYERLCVHFETKTSDFVDTVCDIPDGRSWFFRAVGSRHQQGGELKEGEGQTMFRRQAASKLAPIQNHPRFAVNEHSARFLSDHDRWLASGVLLQQRHSIRVIPVFEVTYQYLAQPISKFWIFGEQRKVYIESFPSKYYHSCAIQ